MGCGSGGAASWAAGGRNSFCICGRTCTTYRPGSRRGKPVFAEIVGLRLVHALRARAAPYPHHTNLGEFDRVSIHVQDATNDGTAVIERNREAVEDLPFSDHEWLPARSHRSPDLGIPAGQKGRFAHHDAERASGDLREREGAVFIGQHSSRLPLIWTAGNNGDARSRYRAAVTPSTTRPRTIAVPGLVTAGGRSRGG